MSFIISLDFELYWGVRDTRGRKYFKTLKNVHEVVPQLLALFEKYDVACTWASVGALCAENYQDFIQNVPKQLPSYEDKVFSPFYDLDYLSSLDESFLFAPKIVSAIQNSPKQEFASHTFSHYYALEQGQCIEEFKSDMSACSKL
ncbi:polysaccharide deacetylase family protein [Pseudoalteromonas sp. APC 3356]|jgi:peptidoglycan/xylan/chitin deacetylase (PgdA/CDA1 family)|uniref:polysaccharide deacetylase family protein n=1 Tax=unclassified Pseudoalteromonas TaxID=194690 RepID=UPI00036DE11D|nr:MULTISPECIES: polysaccharide deacetylase family protein [unclassified Pseudoalteromonas]MDN3434315.1 polysaccharide deacetylase family protein [Pseudoalteromonas sp. APC 3356]